MSRSSYNSSRPASPRSGFSHVMTGEGALLRVWLLLAQEKAVEALQELTCWKEQAQTQGRMHAVLEMVILVPWLTLQFLPRFPSLMIV